MKKILKLLLILFLLTACSNKKEDNTFTVDIYKDDTVDRANFDISVEEFAKHGFELGDSLDIELSNGDKLSDVPYLNGYYVKLGGNVVVAYPSNEHISISICYGGFWTAHNLEEGSSATFSLNTKGKYLSLYNTLGKSYSNERSEYSSDEEFANFRSLSGGLIKDNFLYRGANPFDNRYNRASTVDNLIKETGIMCDINLSDTNEKIEEYFNEKDFDSNYAKQLYENGDVIALGLSADFSGDKFKEGVKELVRFMLNHEGPYYIHCVEGKDRTGVLCMIFEGLANASYDELKNDYMETYYNYYKIKDGEAYDIVSSNLFDSILGNITKVEKVSDITNETIFNASYNYLLECGLSSEEIDNFITLITK